MRQDGGLYGATPSRHRVTSPGLLRLEDFRDSGRSHWSSEKAHSLCLPRPFCMSMPYTSLQKSMAVNIIPFRIIMVKHTIEKIIEANLTLESARLSVLGEHKQQEGQKSENRKPQQSFGHTGRKIICILRHKGVFRRP
jgi:hypothetical protein